MAGPVVVVVGVEEGEGQAAVGVVGVGWPLHMGLMEFRGEEVEVGLQHGRSQQSTWR